eukprot:4653704-Pleurochrysis_carterae.AAC.1
MAERSRRRRHASNDESEWSQVGTDVGLDENDQTENSRRKIEDNDAVQRAERRRRRRGGGGGASSSSPASEYSVPGNASTGGAGCCSETSSESCSSQHVAGRSARRSRGFALRKMETADSDSRQEAPGYARPPPPPSPGCALVV